MRIFIMLGITISLLAFKGIALAEAVSPNTLDNGYKFVATTFEAQQTGYYVAIKEVDDEWDVIGKSVKAKDVLKQVLKHRGGELFWMDPVKKQLTYFYYNSKKDQFYAISQNKEFECDKRARHNPSYPFHAACIRPFTKRTGIGGVETALSLGAKSTKVFDAETAYAALLHADTFSEIAQLDAQCQATRKTLDAYLENDVIITPVIEDKSGFYNKEPIYKTTKKYTLSSDCDLAQSKIYLNLSVIKQPFIFESGQSQSQEFLYMGEKEVFRPVVKIYKKSTVKGFVNPLTAQDRHLTAVITEIKPTNKQHNPMAIVEFKNTGKTYLSVNKISLHINDRVQTDTLNKPFELPPGTSHKYRMPIKDLRMKYSLYKELTKKEAKTSNISFGFSARYETDNQKQTIHNQRSLSYLVAY